jgi:hypothetical protein
VKYKGNTKKYKKFVGGGFFPPPLKGKINAKEDRG